GKTQRVILPNILYNSHLRLKYKSSFVITDPKKEIIKAVGKYYEKVRVSYYIMFRKINVITKCFYLRKIIICS
ncbi:hypothetical protein, partial [Mycoplasmopsis bovis]|uniref:hypothetical protein n=1 Tax=Mycoplasmopsis bovis TaxID=28903 RepID=UPI003D2BF7FA